MNKHLYVITAIVFGLLAIILASKSLGLARETAMLRLTVATKRQQVQQGEAGEMQAFELVTVKEAVEGIAWHYRLPVAVELQKNSLKVAPLHQQETEQGDRKGQIEVLKDYESILGFLSALSTLPYRLEIRELCVGTDCRDGFNLTAEIKGK